MLCLTVSDGHCYKSVLGPDSEQAGKGDLKHTGMGRLCHSKQQTLLKENEPEDMGFQGRRRVVWSGES